MLSFGEGWTPCVGVKDGLVLLPSVLLIREVKTTWVSEREPEWTSRKEDGTSYS